MNFLFQRYRTVLLGVLLICSTRQTHAQEVTDSIYQKFDRQRSSVLQEKIYLHVDRSAYFTGELLWFKIYYTDATFHKPLGLSKVAYVEVISRENVAVLQAKVELKDGFGSGSFFIKASIPSGNYSIRAYTNWMKNFSPEFYFQKDIVIVNSFEKLEDQKVIETQKYNAHFFPEGGNLVNGLPNSVGFHLTDAYGNGLDLRGAIIDNNNDTVIRFHPLKFGLGNFTITPAAGQSYKAVLADAKKNKILFDLPAALNEGYLLHAEEDADQLIITVRNSGHIAGKPYLFIHSRQRQSFSRELPEQQESIVRINKSELFEGISHITLFDAAHQPVCERLFFLKPIKNLSIRASGIQPLHEKRTKVIIDIDVRNGDRGAMANLSMSVNEIDSILNSDRGDILSYFWVTSDLKGHIESPEYYLSDDKDVAKAIDNLMMTHGWRRFSWKDVLNKKNERLSFVPEYHGHIIHGSIKDISGSATAGIETFVSSIGPNSRLYQGVSDDQGKTQYQTKDFFGEKKIIAQADTRKNPGYKVDLDSPFASERSTRGLPPFRLPADLENQILSRSINLQVQDVYYKEQSEKFINPESDSLPFFGKPDETYFLDDYTRFPVMEEVMREYISGVYVRKHKDGFHFFLLNSLSGSLLREDPLILLDGVPMFNVDKIMAYNPLQVKKIDVLTRKYYLGRASFPGIVKYTSFAGDLSNMEVDSDATVLDYDGLQLRREFYSPSYDLPSQQKSRLPDRRTLLYWNPQIVTSPEGKQQIEFYTSDIPGNYIIKIEGITPEGLVGGTSVRFSVK